VVLGIKGRPCRAGRWGREGLGKNRGLRNKKEKADGMRCADRGVKEEKKRVYKVSFYP